MTELQLENKFIKSLIGDNNYQRVYINNEEELKENFRTQISLFNKKNLGRSLSDKEFDRLFTEIQGDQIKCALKLHSYQSIESDIENKKIDIALFDFESFDNNIFQVANQITIEGKEKNRYDVTILINGLPLIQIELKKNGIDFKQAFNQIDRYRKNTFTGLFNFLEIFVISNQVYTKYFANSKKLNYGYCFNWANEENENINDLFDFSRTFLKKHHVCDMISRFTVIDEDSKDLIIMRPYQVNAVKALIKKAKENQNAYVWHTTGSGKTLTSFKLCRLLRKHKDIDKVFFLVDRNDLDSQTVEQFNRFEKDSVDSTDKTKKLISQMKDPTKNLIITTIQKMDKACKDSKNKKIITTLNKTKVVFVVDECHRSQAGMMHKRINKAFPNALYFGFTGTPIFASEQDDMKLTTGELFGECVHKYTILDGIKDKNVLGFSIEYYQTIKSYYDGDDKVEDIDREEVINSKERVENIVDAILKMHNNKTHGKEFNSMLAVSSIEMLNAYYDAFKKKDHDLKIGAIYTYAPNEDPKQISSKESLSNIINDYNKMFRTEYSIDTFKGYKVDISKKVKNNDLDLLIVVDMFLTGFDAKPLNTLYVDKNLKEHSLIQAISRTNRIHTPKKTWGNIVFFRTNKHVVDDAITQFSDSKRAEEVILRDFETCKNKFTQLIEGLKIEFKTYKDVQNERSEERQKRFIEIFSSILKGYNDLSTFYEYSWDNKIMKWDDFEGFKSVYLNIAREHNQKRKADKVSIIDDVEFCVDLIENNKINTDYIVGKMYETAVSIPSISEIERDIIRDRLLKELDSSNNVELISKKTLIQELIMAMKPCHTSSDFIDMFIEKGQDEYNNLSLKYNILIEDLQKWSDKKKLHDMYPVEEIKKKVKEQNPSLNIFERGKVINDIIERLDIIENVEELHQIVIQYV